MLWLRKLVVRRGGVDLFVERERSAGEPRQAVVNELPLVIAVAPGTRLVVAIAPAFTIGLVRPSGLRSMAASELNGIRWRSPPAFTHLLRA